MLLEEMQATRSSQDTRPASPPCSLPSFPQVEVGLPIQVSICVFLSLSLSLFASRARKIPGNSQMSIPSRPTPAKRTREGYHAVINLPSSLNIILRSLSTFLPAYSRETSRPNTLDLAQSLITKSRLRAVSVMVISNRTYLGQRSGGI